MASQEIRSFLCIEVAKPEILEKIDAIKRELRMSKAKIKFVENENIHITLKFLGNISKKMIEVISGIMDKMTQKRFTLELTNIGVFPGLDSPKVLWIGTGQGTSEVQNIFNYLESNLTQLGFKRDKRFSSHITIGRVKSGEHRGHLISIIKHTRARDLELGSMVVKDVLIKKSKLTPKGPIYSVLYKKELDQG